MQVLDFMNTHDNWEDILTQPPYCIKVKRDGEYVLLKYNQLNSDFSNEIVKECRGAIFTKTDSNQYICVSRAFDKFFNESEENAATIDWCNVVVEEKVDGTLIKLWNYNDTWHVSTNGTINAFNAQVGDTDCSFGDLVVEALGGEDKFNQFTSLLDKCKTYMFELVSPKSKVTIFYPETKLYYLGERKNMFSMNEGKRFIDFMDDYGILCPKVYPLSTLEECLLYVKHMMKDQEGFVIRDKNFNRIKLKSPEYLIAFHMNNNGVLTVKRIIEMIKNEQLDDFLAYCPEYKEQVDKIVTSIVELALQLDIDWGLASIFACCERREFAERIKKFTNKDFLFKRYDNRDLVAMDYIMSQPTNKIKEMIGRG